MIRRHVIALALLGAARGAAAQRVEGEVRRIDAGQGRVTIAHAGIPRLDMPPMTMTFRVRDPRQLEGLAVGDKVRFEAEKIGGQYTVTAIAKAR